MGDLIPYEYFKKKQREKKYGSDASVGRRLRALGFPEDYNPMLDLDNPCPLLDEDPPECA